MKAQNEGILNGSLLAGPMQRWCESLGFHDMLSHKAMLGRQMGPKKVGVMMLQTPKKEKNMKRCEHMWTVPTTELVVNDFSIFFL